MKSLITNEPMNVEYDGMTIHLERGDQYCVESLKMARLHWISLVELGYLDYGEVNVSFEDRVKEAREKLKAEKQETDSDETETEEEEQEVEKVPVKRKRKKKTSSE